MAKAKKRSSKKKAARATKARRAPARKAAKPAGSSIEAFAKKIVRMSTGTNFGPAEVRELYHVDAVSVEGSGATSKGHAELDQKMAGWQQMTSGMISKPRNVWTRGNTICIEWDSTVTMRDGRTVKLHEVAVHEIKNGKIQRERYYYDPSALAPPQQSLPGV